MDALFPRALVNDTACLPACLVSDYHAFFSYRVYYKTSITIRPPIHLPLPSSYLILRLLSYDSFLLVCALIFVLLKTFTQATGSSSIKALGLIFSFFCFSHSPMPCLSVSLVLVYHHQQKDNFLSLLPVLINRTLLVDAGRYRSGTWYLSVPGVVHIGLFACALGCNNCLVCRSGHRLLLLQYAHHDLQPTALPIGNPFFVLLVIFLSSGRRGYRYPYR